MDDLLLPASEGVEHLEPSSSQSGENSKVGLQLDAVPNSAVLKRLISEVAAEETGVPRSYNRTFNRHNR